MGKEDQGCLSGQLPAMTERRDTVKKYALLAEGDYGLTFLGRPTNYGEDLVFDSEEEAREALAEWREEYDAPEVSAEIVAFDSHLLAT